MSLASSSYIQGFGTPDGLSSRVSDPLLSGRQSPLEGFDPVTESTPKTTGKRFIVYLSLLGAVIIVVVLAVVLPIYFVVLKPKAHEDASNPSGSYGGGPGTTASDGVVVSIKSLFNFKVLMSFKYGVNGSTVVMANGTSFTYVNEFGGYC